MKEPEAVQASRPPGWTESSEQRVAYLQSRGVRIPLGAHRVFVAPEVDPQRIEPEAVLYNVDLYGEATAIGRGTCLGQRGRVVLMNTLLGRQVEVGDGFLGAEKGRVVLLDHAKVRFGCEIRPQSVMEEEASIARSNGLKNTFLGYASVIGSLADFCDATLLGGTDRRDNHSEVGSVTVHANFDHQGQKWGSWFGPAPEGVFLRKPLIFLGAGATFVAPLLISFGTLSVAGNVLRDSITEEGVLIAQPPMSAKRSHYQKGRRGRLMNKIQTTAYIIGNYKALAAWYRWVRQPFFRSDPFEYELMSTVLFVLEQNVAERIKRLEAVIKQLPQALELLDTSQEKLRKEQQGILEEWPKSYLPMLQKQDYPELEELRQRFLEQLPPGQGQYFPQYIKNLPLTTVEAGVAWLTAIVTAHQLST